MTKLLLLFGFAIAVLTWGAPTLSAEQATNVIGTIERADGDRFIIKSENTPLGVRLVEAADERTPEQKKIVTNAKAFLEYQYVEIKDLAKQFLLVIAGFLTLSVTFAEKIVDLKTASGCMKFMLGAIWVFSFAAFALGGLAIFLIYNAGVMAKYATTHFKIIEAFGFDYVDIMGYSHLVMTLGGLAFSLALGLLVLVGIGSFRAKKAAAPDLTAPIS